MGYEANKDTYLDSGLSNKYLKAIIHSLEPIIFNKKGDVSVIFFQIKPQLSH